MHIRAATRGSALARWQADRLAALVEEHADYVPAWFQRGQLLASERRVQAARDVLTEGIAVARRVGDSHAEGEMTDFLESL